MSLRTGPQVRLGYPLTKRGATLDIGANDGKVVHLFVHDIFLSGNDSRLRSRALVTYADLRSKVGKKPWVRMYRQGFKALKKRCS